jgi:hypothetical protein
VIQFTAYALVTGVSPLGGGMLRIIRKSELHSPIESSEKGDAPAEDDVPETQRARKPSAGKPLSIAEWRDYLDWCENNDVVPDPAMRPKLI